jgi:hypothetical protein
VNSSWVRRSPLLYRLLTPPADKPFFAEKDSVASRKSLLLISVIFILIGAQSALGQYSGGHGGGHRHDGGSPSGPTADTASGDIKGFERAVALQATPDQSAQFQRLSASTQDARRRSQQMLQVLASGKTLGNVDPLANAIEEAQSDSEKFLQSFSKEQEDGLKKLTKKLRKLDSELTARSRVLGRGLQNHTPDEQLSAALQKLDQALGDFQSQQRALAAEMGIQGQDNLDRPDSQPVSVLKK